MKSEEFIGRTVVFRVPPSLLGDASVGCRKEGEGPLGGSFDYLCADAYFGADTWERAESAMVRRAVELALDKSGLAPSDISLTFAGDLLAQCVGSSFALREFGIPHFGVYGACSTMSEALALAAMTAAAGYADYTLAATSSHFCTAERQFRTPLEYGGQRPPSTQWTVTAAGAAVLSPDGPGPYITAVTPGKIIDAGITDANNMGAAMAPAAYDTIRAHLDSLGAGPDRYDLILTGDLGAVGSDILRDFFRNDAQELFNHDDCGLMIYDRDAQDVHSGGSGCGCSASVLCGHILNGMRAGRWNRILFCATGALLSAVSSQQGESVPGICCAVEISNSR